MTTQGKAGFKLWQIYSDANKNFKEGLNKNKAGEQVELTPLYQALKTAADDVQRYHNTVTNGHEEG